MQLLVSAMAWVILTTTTVGAQPARNNPGAPPRFEAFPAASGPPALNAPLIIGRREMTYRTRLRAAATERPNFAGHYILASWGCGTECLMGAAIDARTGRVTFLPFATCCFSMAPEGTQDMVAFRPDSTLIVLLGARDGREADIGAHEYRIEGDRFVHIRRVPFPARR